MDDFQPIDAERIQLDLLIQNGMKFNTPKRSLLRFVSKEQERTWIIKPPFLGTLDHLSREFVDMDFSEERIQANGLQESKRLVYVNAKRCAKVVAIALLRGKWSIRFLTPFLASYLLWRVTPSKLFQLTMLINTLSNLGDFTNSIRYLSVNRTTIPALMENNPVSQQD